MIAVAKEKIKNENIQFEHCDVTQNIVPVEKFLAREDKEGFDIISCFSVSMWIHLNHGERGLTALFSNSYKLCKNLFLFEPQPWKCYMTAARRMRKLKQPHFEHLEKISQRQDQLIPYLVRLCEAVGFKLVADLGKTHWERQIFLFKK